MTLDGATLWALGYGAAVFELGDDWPSGYRTSLIRHYHRVPCPRPRVVTHAESNRRWRAKQPKAVIAAAKRIQRSKWSDEKRALEAQKAKDRRAKKRVMGA